MPYLSRRQMLGAVACLAMMPLAGCSVSPSRRFVQQTFFNFDTVCVVGGAMEQGLLDEAQALCEHFEQLFSRTVSTSDVARVNVAQGEPVEVDALTADLVGRALSYCEVSGGLFDITIGAVSELWDFAKGVVPSQEAIEAALAHVGWQGVEVSGTTIRLADPDARIDLGGIAKGYITDRLIDFFVERGVADAFVNLGGNVAVMGTNERGEAWSIGVRDPSDPSGASVVASVQTNAGSLVTSGLYERSFEKDGTRYWHILDPRTGHPVKTNVVSASIFSTDSIDGDGYTKPLFMMGRNDALAFIESHPGLQALLIESDGTRTTTAGSSFR